MRNMKALVAWVVLMAAAAAAGEETWNLDPAAWRREGAALVSRGNAQMKRGGFAIMEGAHSRTVRVRAEVTPKAMGGELAAEVGVAVCDNLENYWFLKLVQTARGAGNRRAAALVECMQSTLGAERDLTCVKRRGAVEWKEGAAYVLELELSAEGVCGRVTPAGADRPQFECAYAFGKREAVDRGRGALLVQGDFTAQVTGVRVETGAAAEPTPVPAVPYASDQYIRGVTAEPTGFFRCAKVGGRWTLIDPLGRGYRALGVGLVSRNASYCEKLGYSEYGRSNDRKFPNPGEWEADTVAKLSSWGFSALGNGAQLSLGRRGLSHCLNLYIGRRLCAKDDDWSLCRYRGQATTGFPDVFHPQFAAVCDWFAREFCARHRNDPWLLGYYLDNELDWVGPRGPNRASGTGLFEVAMAKDDAHPAKRAALAHLAGRKATPEIKRDFVRLVAERYFSTVVGAVRRHDPNHLVLGCRFAGVRGAHEEVWRAAARHCDVLTFNVYPWIDLDHGTVASGGYGTEPLADWSRRMSAAGGKPFYVTEWSFTAYDSGLPCQRGAGEVFQRQSERARATELFARTLLASPCYVGYDFFSWVDQPRLGWSAADPENANFGLLNAEGEPYWEMTEMFRRLHGEFAAGHGEPPPAPRLAYVREGDGWCVSNSVGLVLRGRVGGKAMVDDIRLGGKRLGHYTGMAGLLVDSRPVWEEAEVVRDVGYEERGGYGALTVVAEGGQGGRRFRLTHRLVVAPGNCDFRVSILGIENVGAAPLAVERLLMRLYPDDPEAAAENQPSGNMHPWDGASLAAWRFRDGRRFGLEAVSNPNARFLMTVNAKGARNPDLGFPIAGTATVAPGGTWTPLLPLYARAVID